MLRLWETWKSWTLFFETGLVDVNTKDKSETTSLHTAASKGDFGIYAFLLGHGADSSVRDNKGRTLLFAACARKGGLAR